MNISPDILAFDRAIVAQPVWNRFDTAAEAFGLPENVLLHAGPPINSVQDMARPILNSACVAAVFEGLSQNFETAEQMIAAGEIKMLPAQDHSVVVPLAAVISASMPLHTVYDAWQGEIRCYAPINGGIGPSLRLGLRSEAVLEHIRWLNSQVRDALEEGIGEGIQLVPLAAHGLLHGDDCHGKTPAAGAALYDELVLRSCQGIRNESVNSFMQASPSLFLNLWMAATKVMMKASEGIEGSGLITAAGGNGCEFGIQISSNPGKWFSSKATPPQGDMGDHPVSVALGAIGDSAVVDCFGLGAMATSGLNAIASDVGDPRKEAFEIASEFCIGKHPYFRSKNQPLGCSVRSTKKDVNWPAISLGILDKEGQRGRLGGGIFKVPEALIKAARLGSNL